jgi:hypothetical protein
MLSKPHRTSHDNSKRSVTAHNLHPQQRPKQGGFHRISSHATTLARHDMRVSLVSVDVVEIVGVHAPTIAPAKTTAAAAAAH